MSPDCAGGTVLPAERAQLLATAGRFAVRHLTPWRDSPEYVPSPAENEAVVESAASAGLLVGTATPGYGWLVEDRDGLDGTLALLALLAAHHATTAFQLHRLALGEWLRVRLGAPSPARRTLLWLPTGHALAEPGFVNFLGRGIVPSPEEALLPLPGAPLVWASTPAWDQLAGPVPVGDAIRWSVLAEKPGTKEAGSPHGLDGTRQYTATLSAREPPAALCPDMPAAEAAPVMIELLGRDALGLMALAMGVVRRAGEQAREQAARRVQGGGLIRSHAAVQGLLAETRVAVISTETALKATEAPPRDLATLCRVLALRSIAHELLCRGANASMQVFGGSGYMRDMGLERAVRDCNQLRVCAGAPADLRLFIARAELPS